MYLCRKQLKSILCLKILHSCGDTPITTSSSISGTNMSPLSYIHQNIDRLLTVSRIIHEKKWDKDIFLQNIQEMF